MPYTPRTLTTRARMDGGLNWQDLPPYATFIVPFAGTPLGSGTISDPVARAMHNDMRDATLGTWNSGQFTPARPGRYRLDAQFGAFQTEAQGPRMEIFFRIEAIREGSGIVLAVADSVDHMSTEEERVVTLNVQATVPLLPTDVVQARFAFVDGENLNIITEHTRTFFDVTAYWN